jgi:hypothetical protein
MPKIRISIIALLAVALSPMAAAQMRGRGGVAIGGTGFRHFRSGGFGYPFFYSDYGPESPPAAPAPVVIEKRAFQPDPKPQPILIEWQGDRFVRYGGAQPGAQSPDYGQVASLSPPAKVGQSEVAHELPPATLIYRDGHREQVNDYVITRGVLYARSDGYTQSSRDIQLSTLDLSATFRANQDSGVKFVLPERPNDVVTRP